MRAILAVEDGRILEGDSCGVRCMALGEICFNTSMTGYQEVLTDPSYRGQIVAMTYPLIGNYGTNEADAESKGKVKCKQVRDVLRGRSVVRWADSIVGGTTTRGLVSMVRAAGAREVHLRVSSSPVTGPCYYGIDTPTREELIAANMSVEEITTAVGADTLGYLTLEGRLASVPGGPDGCCRGLCSGDFPPPPPARPE